MDLNNQKMKNHLPFTSDGVETVSRIHGDVTTQGCLASTYMHGYSRKSDECRDVGMRLEACECEWQKI